MKEIQELDKRIEIILPYENKRYKLVSGVSDDCVGCAFSDCECYRIPKLNFHTLCCDLGGIWKEIKDEQAVTPCNQLNEAVKHFVCDVESCCSVHINCGKCGSGEDVYFVPKGLISKLKSVIDEEKGKDNGND